MLLHDVSQAACAEKKNSLCSLSMRVPRLHCGQDIMRFCDSPPSLAVAQILLMGADNKDIRLSRASLTRAVKDHVKHSASW